MPLTKSCACHYLRVSWLYFLHISSLVRYLLCRPTDRIFGCKIGFSTLSKPLRFYKLPRWFSVSSYSAICLVLRTHEPAPRVLRRCASLSLAAELSTIYCPSSPLLNRWLSFDSLTLNCVFCGTRSASGTCTLHLSLRLRRPQTRPLSIRVSTPCIRSFHHVSQSNL